MQLWRVSYYTACVLRIADSALKHGCSREDVSHAYDMALFEGVVDADAEPPKYMTIGPHSAGNLLELVGGQGRAATTLSGTRCVADVNT